MTGLVWSFAHRARRALLAILAPLAVLAACSFPAPAAVPTRSLSPAATPAPALQLDPVTTSLEEPLRVVHAGDGSGRLFVLEKAGRIRVIKGGALLERPFLDIHEKVSVRWERGLLGMAWEPGRAERFYLNYTDREGKTVIARYRASRRAPDTALEGSEEILLTIDQPAANHNGGHLLFGPDGFLWSGQGDGGGANDEFGNGQNPFTLHATFLRLDVSPTRGFRVPSSNPFAGDEEAGVPAIWATGLRNPWQFSIDRATGDLWVADVGQRRWEEINRVPASAAGLNYGWPILEGTNCFAAEPCDPEGLVLPIVEYSHDEGCAVTGGHVYRGGDLAALRGQYLFGDFCGGQIWSVAADAPPGVAPTLLLDTELAITSFGEDEAGELYLTSFDGGLYRLAPVP